MLLVYRHLYYAVGNRALDASGAVAPQRLSRAVFICRSAPPVRRLVQASNVVMMVAVACAVRVRRGLPVTKGSAVDHAQPIARVSSAVTMVVAGRAVYVQKKRPVTPPEPASLYALRIVRESNVVKTVVEVPAALALPMNSARTGAFASIVPLAAKG